MYKLSGVKLKIPPPIVTLVFAALMYLTNIVFNFEVKHSLQVWLAVIFCMFACLFLSPAIYEFYKNKTTVNPLKPETTSVLVINGVYRYSRNPMYLGMSCLLLAWLAWIGNPLNLVILVVYIGYMNRFQIIIEEQALEIIFGEEFKQYKEEVRRWI